jgi:hypothetical protein
VRSVPTKDTDPDALRTALLGIKGVGSYGANHLLMLLLGHYGEIPRDSEVRAYLGVSPKASRKEIEPAPARSARVAPGDGEVALLVAGNLEG